LVWSTDTEKLKSRDTLQMVATLPTTTIKKAGAKGETLFYRAPNLGPAQPGSTL
jgi:hypothetical protein